MKFRHAKFYFIAVLFVFNMKMPDIRTEIRTLFVMQVFNRVLAL